MTQCPSNDQRCPRKMPEPTQDCSKCLGHLGAVLRNREFMEGRFFQNSQYLSQMESEADKIDPRRNQIDTPIIQIPTNDSMISRLTRGHCGNSSILADSIESRLADQTPLMPASHSNGRRRGAFRSMTHERTSRSEVSPEDGSKGFESRLKKFGGFHIAYVGVDSILTAKRTRIIPLLGKLVS